MLIDSTIDLVKDSAIKRPTKSFINKLKLRFRCDSAFSSTYSYSTLGGYDTVQFYDSNGNDVLVTKPAYAYMYGTGFYNYVNGFDSTAAYATNGGYDQAQLYDSTGSDVVETNNSYAKITVGSTGYDHRAVYFDEVDAWSTKGGTDTVNELGALDFIFGEFGNWI